MAFKELVYICKRLNRTLVLPNAGISTLGIRGGYHTHPLDLYFDVHELSKYVSSSDDCMLLIKTTLEEFKITKL